MGASLYLRSAARPAAGLLMRPKLGLLGLVDRAADAAMVPAPLAQASGVGAEAGVLA